MTDVNKETSSQKTFEDLAKDLFSENTQTTSVETKTEENDAVNEAKNTNSMSSKDNDDLPVKNKGNRFTKMMRDKAKDKNKKDRSRGKWNEEDGDDMDENVTFESFTDLAIAIVSDLEEADLSDEDIVAVLEDALDEDALASLVEEMMEAEEISEEELNELSKSKLGSYVKKATADVIKKNTEINSDKDTKPEFIKKAGKMASRIDNVVKAKSKMTKESIDETAASDTLKPNSMPASKAAMIGTAVDMMNKMENSFLIDFFNKMLDQIGKEADGVPSGAESKNKTSIKMKPSDAEGSGAMAMFKMPKVSVKEDIDAMFEGEELSEEFKEKVNVLFEAALNAKVNLELVRIQEEYDAEIAEALEEIQEEMEEKFDRYFDFFADKWMEENEIAITNQLRSDILEDFMDGMKNLFAEHYITVPEEKSDLVEELAQKVEELEETLNASIAENAELKAVVSESVKNEIIEELKSDLVMTDQERFVSLAEGIDFNGDLETFKKKLMIVKENYILKVKDKKVPSNINEETFETETKPQAPIDSEVNRYLKALSRTTTV